MEYDVIVIGAGSGGLNIAGFMNKAGFKTLLIDKKDEAIGGDCLNHGCVPSKALIHASRLVHEAKQAQRFGLTVHGTANLRKVKEYVHAKREVIREHEKASHFRKLGMHVALGHAHFVSKNEVKVGNKTYKGKKIVIATGSRPRQLSVPGIENVDIITNESVFDLEHLPKHLVVIGGGPIGMELAQAFCRLGSKVSVIIRGMYFLPKEPPEIAQVLHAELKKEGIKFYFNSVPEEFVSKHELRIRDASGKKHLLKFDSCFVGIGRQLNYEGLDLEKAGIEVEGNRIKRNEYLQTTNSNVYLCGDIAGSYQFTHAAELHAAVLINNFFSPIKKKLNNDKLSWVTFTDPEIATFGLSESELNKRKVQFRKISLTFEDDDRAIVDEATHGKLILFIDKNKILGGSMVAKGAGEIAQELILANSGDIDIKKLFEKIYPYPTATRINKKAIAQIYAEKLNERTKKVLKFLY